MATLLQSPHPRQWTPRQPSEATPHYDNYRLNARELMVLSMFSASVRRFCRAPT